MPDHDQPDERVGEDEEEDVATAEAAVEHDLADVDALVRERDELLDVSRRLQADFENYRKRMMREQTTVVERATSGLVEQLLPVLDAFEAARAQLARDASSDPDAVRKGVELVESQLQGVLERAGLEMIDAVGAPFDPHEHDAVLQEPGDGDPVVGEVMRAGYRLKGRVLRPAMVKVTHASHGGDATRASNE